MSSTREPEGKRRSERKTREKHHGVGRAGLRKSDRALPTEVESHEGVGAEGDEVSTVNKRQRR
jgi:hypothetical protein